ncbi:MAG: hypothetical protein IKE76_04050 [Clostridia bacterium]|nr:hypothetical protein [Clostridia bacterium]
MTPTNVPGFVTAPTWNGRGITHITGHIIIADGDRILLNRYDMRELLIDADHRLTALALDLDRRMPEGWDPDAYFTPLENTLHKIAEAAGYDYPEDIAAEAYRRRRLAAGPMMEAVE